ncbi:hypothetical protein [Streptomyces enissocaesilis]|uniref:Secreted protein n=1 Tax=Streptomyces enissocaesilis TaxID=332589 RepID=A0ABP6J5C4_9ACTN
MRLKLVMFSLTSLTVLSVVGSSPRAVRPGCTEAAHELNAVALQVDWQASGEAGGTLEEWRERNRAVFRAIDNFHEGARVDLGVDGSVSGEKHPERDLLLPSARREGDTSNV